jgi:hypothetical protein
VYDAEEMPLDAYLNSEAHELVTICLERLQEKPQVPMDPNTNIQLHIGGRMVTRDLKNTARGIIQLPMLRTYYCKRFEWSDNIFDIIDWDIFRPVYKKHTTNKGIQWMHKFCIKKLPTGERIHKRKCQEHSTVKDLNGAKTSSISLTGTSFDQYIRNVR